MIEEVRKYYDESVEQEWNRLNNPYSIVEYKSTMFLLDKYFPKKGAILDIGAGPGRYAVSLLEKGYKVSLLDISQRELDFAKKQIEEQGMKAEAYYCKSALELENLKPGKYDGLLIMGPLYHLHSREERIKVLKASLELLEEDGTSIISYINTWGALKASVGEFPEVFSDKVHFERYLKGDLKFTSEESFTATFFTTPYLAMEEVREAGYEIISYAGAESFLSGLGIQMRNLKNNLPEIYENYLEKAAEFCEQPQYRDTTEHVHIIARKEKKI